MEYGLNRQAEVGALPWIETVKGHPYFVTDAGDGWTPIGHNDAITWPTLAGLFRRRDLASVEAYFRTLQEQGVNCLRLMLEYAQQRHRYIENPIGAFVPDMVTLWDDIFRLCERTGIRVLLTPVDTFWTWRHWRWHPYSRDNGGPLDHPSRLLLCRDTRDAIKARLTFAVRRWGGSGALFAYDLWNEIHPGQAQESADCFGEFIHDLSAHVRGLERLLYGRSHPQTVSLFGPELVWRPHMPLAEPIFRHPDLDFASIHIYAEGTIDDPKDTVAPALEMGRIVASCLSEITDDRPFFDSEHGPIHSFKDHHVTLPEAFDDEYFRHMQWAHAASGGAGGGMRWPNRNPHILTPGMHAAQCALAQFTAAIDWTSFRRRNISEAIRVGADEVAAFGCGDAAQAFVWLLRTRPLRPDGTLDPAAAPIATELAIPGLQGERFEATAWSTTDGHPPLRLGEGRRCGDAVAFAVPALGRDLAIAVRRTV